MRMDGDHRDFLYVSGLAGKAALEARTSHRGSHPLGHGIPTPLKNDGVKVRLDHHPNSWGK